MSVTLVHSKCSPGVVMLPPLYLHNVLTGHHQSVLLVSDQHRVGSTIESHVSGSKVGFGILSSVDRTLLNVKASSKSVTLEISFAVGILELWRC